MANTRLISTHELPSTGTDERSASARASAAQAESLTKTRLIDMSQRFAALDPASIPLPTLAAGTSRANLETTVVPVEHLLARRAPVEPPEHPSVRRAQGESASAKPCEASTAGPCAATPRKRNASFSRMMVASVIGAVVSSTVIAANVMGAAHKPPSVPENIATPAQPAKTSAKFASPAPARREPSALAPAPPAPATPRETGVSLERAASDAVVEGRFAEAAQIYERLARSMPQRLVYKEAARILRER